MCECFLSDWEKDYKQLIYPRNPDMAFDYSFLCCIETEQSLGSGVLDGIDMWFDIFRSKVLKEDTVEKESWIKMLKQKVFFNEENMKQYKNMNVSDEISSINVLNYLGQANTFIEKNPNDMHVARIKAMIEEVVYFISNNKVAITELFVREAQNNAVNNLEKWKTFGKYIETVLRTREPVDIFDYIEGVGYRNQLDQILRLSECYFDVTSLVNQMNDVDNLIRQSSIATDRLLSETVRSFFPKSYYWWMYSIPAWVSFDE